MQSFFEKGDPNNPLWGQWNVIECLYFYGKSVKTSVHNFPKRTCIWDLIQPNNCLKLKSFKIAINWTYSYFVETLNWYLCQIICLFINLSTIYIYICTSVDRLWRVQMLKYCQDLCNCGFGIYDCCWLDPYF